MNTTKEKELKMIDEYLEICSVREVIPPSEFSDWLLDLRIEIKNNIANN